MRCVFVEVYDAKGKINRFFMRFSFKIIKAFSRQLQKNTSEELMNKKTFNVLRMEIFICVVFFVNSYSFDTLWKKGSKFKYRFSPLDDSLTLKNGGFTYFIFLSVPSRSKNLDKNCEGRKNIYFLTRFFSDFVVE